VAADGLVASLRVIGVLAGPITSGRIKSELKVQMGNFFNDRWRKVGGVTLVLACVAVFGDVWSHFVWDRFFIRVGDSTQIITSFDGWVSWASRDVRDLEVYFTNLVPKWKSWPATEVRRYSFTEPRQWSMPYGLIAIALTLLSVCLMFSKRRPNERGRGSVKSEV
jgi:hypothetical protein